MDTEGRDDAIEQFWRVARIRGKVTRLELFVGQAPKDTIPPPAWSFSDDRAAADEFVAEVLAGTRTSIVASVAEFGEEPVPDVGDLSIVLDGGGEPRVLIRTTAVHRQAAGDSVRTPAGGGPSGDDDLAPGTPVLVEHFEAIYPKSPKRRPAPA
ncbi:hypothetical protein EXU48_06340 [Occultella glacieicola]|uniref:Uncharacterized protein n=1 Tax=Occultella glacieicola TaxID=2518684 RepID=A0ABY2E676_9MICO|nr:hypothetical protein [Occultella glacieicola]TDE95876.1 hypothetical protein EXU48_06340 [Occultella glacieicola]